MGGEATANRLRAPRLARAMRTGIWGVLALLLAAGTAGCSDDPSPPGPGGEGDDANGVDAGLQPPSWRVGDWWTYSSPDGELTFVVSADAGTEYTVDSPTATLAWFDALFDVSTMGAVRKSDLAGSQPSGRIQFFQWPLVDNGTWSMTFDKGQGGGDLSVRAARIEPEVYEMTARFANGTVYVTYIYDNATKWLREIDFKDQDGSDGFVASLKDHGADFADDLVRWDYEVEADAHGDLSQLTPGAIFYDVPTTATDVYADVEVHCTQGFTAAGTAPFPFIGSLVGTDDRGAGSPGEPCPVDVSFHGVAGAVGPATPGAGGETWGYDLAGGPGTVGTYDFTIYIRTATLFKAGEAPA